jgi:hypothetical protein
MVSSKKAADVAGRERDSEDRFPLERLKRSVVFGRDAVDFLFVF